MHKGKALTIHIVIDRGGREKEPSEQSGSSSDGECQKGLAITKVDPQL